MVISIFYLGYYIFIGNVFIVFIFKYKEGDQWMVLLLYYLIQDENIKHLEYLAKNDITLVCCR